MNIDNPKGTEPTVSAKTKVRRTFLKRATATAVVGAIPAKSVWATGITNSIVASGHGSDFADGRDIKLLSPCSILTALSENPGANLNLNFSQVFGEGPDQTFSEILSCHCSCPDVPDDLDHAISNVVFYTDQGEQFKIEDETDGILDPRHPEGYFSYVESQVSGNVIDYVIKAGQEGHNGGGYFGPTGARVTMGNPTWFQGHSGMPEVKTSDNGVTYLPPSTAGSNCEGDETTLAMIAIYLNARFDYYFRGGIPTENWSGSNGIYYPILSSAASVTNLVASIKASKNQLNAILAEYGASYQAPIC